MKRLLLLTYTFPPLTTGGTPVVMNISRYLSLGGWAPMVLTASEPRGMPVEKGGGSRLIPSVLPVRRIPEPRLPGAGNAYSRPANGGTARRSSLLRSILKDLADRFVLVPDRLVAWRRRMVREGVRMARGLRADAVMSFGPHHSLHLHALAVSRRLDLPCFCFFGDLWLADANVSWPSELNRKLEAFLERQVVGRAAGLVVTTRGSADYFRNAYSGLCPPVHVALNAYDPARVSRAAAPSPAGERMVITYTGNFFANQSPEIFLRGLRIFMERLPEARIRVRLVGGMEPPFHRMHEEMGLQEVVSAPGPVDFNSVPSLQASSDLLLATLSPQPGAELKCSSKLAEYLRVGRPVLAVAPPGDMTGLVERLQAGYTCPPEPEALAQCLRRIYDDWRRGSMVGPADPAEVRSLLDARVVMRRLAGFLDRVARDSAEREWSR